MYCRILVGLVASLASGAAFADVPIYTVDGQLVRVSEERLTSAYLDLVRSEFNVVSDMGGGSTAYGNPGVLIGGKMYRVGFIQDEAGQWSAQGFCKSKMHSLVTAVSVPEYPLEAGGVVLFKRNGEIENFQDYPPSHFFAFAGIICK